MDKLGINLFEAIEMKSFIILEIAKTKINIRKLTVVLG